jgi:hypothetical protein
LSALLLSAIVLSALLLSAIVLSALLLSAIVLSALLLSAIVLSALLRFTSYEFDSRLSSSNYWSNANVLFQSIMKVSIKYNQRKQIKNYGQMTFDPLSKYY